MRVAALGAEQRGDAAPSRWRARPRRRCGREPAGRHTPPIIRWHAVDLLEGGRDGGVALERARHEDRPELGADPALAPAGAGRSGSCVPGADRCRGRRSRSGPARAPPTGGRCARRRAGCSREQVARPGEEVVAGRGGAAPSMSAIEHPAHLEWRMTPPHSSAGERRPGHPRVRPQRGRLRGAGRPARRRGLAARRRRGRRRRRRGQHLRLRRAGQEGLDRHPARGRRPQGRPAARRGSSRSAAWPSATARSSPTSCPRPTPCSASTPTATCAPTCSRSSAGGARRQPHAAATAARLLPLSPGRAPGRRRGRRAARPRRPVDAREDLAMPTSRRRPPGPASSALGSTARPRAPLKIASGCDRRCSFCAIPMFRGSFVSPPSRRRPRRGAAGWRSRASRSCSSSARTPRPTARTSATSRLLETLLPELAAIDGVERVRVSYLQPAETRPGLLEAIADHARASCRTSTCPSSTPRRPCCAGCAASATPRRFLEPARAGARARRRRPACAATSSSASPARPRTTSTELERLPRPRPGSTSSASSATPTRTAPRPRGTTASWRRRGRRRARRARHRARRGAHRPAGRGARRRARRRARRGASTTRSGTVVGAAADHQGPDVDGVTIVHVPEPAPAAPRSATSSRPSSSAPRGSTWSRSRDERHRPSTGARGRRRPDRHRLEPAQRPDACCASCSCRSSRVLLFQRRRRRRRGGASGPGGVFVARDCHRPDRRQDRPAPRARSPTSARSPTPSPTRP